MENPTMSSDDKIVKMLKTLRVNNQFDFDFEMRKDTVWTLLDCLMPADISPEAQKQMNSLRTNYKKKYDPTTMKATKSEGVLIEMIWKVFLDGIWWETFGTDSEEVYLSQSETMRVHKSINRRLVNVRKEIKALERQNEKIMEDKGLITQHDLDRELDEQKRKYEEKLDDRYREDRNAYKTLQRQIADIKAERNHIASENNRMKIESDYLRKENEDLIRQIQQMQSCPNPPES